MSNTEPTDQLPQAIEYFPANIISIFSEAFEELMPDHSVAERPLRQVDPNASIGIYCASWSPVEDSQQMGQEEHALARYIVRVQNMTKAMDEAEGRAQFTLEGKMVRAILYRDPGLRVRLGGLQEELMGTVERVQRYGVMKQDFITSELQGVYVFLASTELFVETEIVAL